MSMIRDRRVRLGLSQRALADLSGVSRASLVRAEIDESDVRVETVQRLARALDRIEDRHDRPPARPGDVTVEVLLPGGERVSFTGPPGAGAREAAVFLRMHANGLHER